jgi:hypothetical protein
MLNALFSLVKISTVRLRCSGAKSASVFGTDKRIGAYRFSRECKQRTLLLTVDAKHITFFHERRVCDSPDFAYAGFRQLPADKTRAPAVR